MYNSIYQLVTAQYPDQSVSFEYDENGNRIVMTDSEGQTSCVYDNRNRLLSETRTIQGDTYTVSYQYGAASNITSITYPDESVITYEYDPLNRLTSIPGYAEFTYTNSLLGTVTYSTPITP